MNQLHITLQATLCESMLEKSQCLLSISLGFFFNPIMAFYDSLQAPCEAEAQCAALVKAGKVFAVGTEDMDALTFGSNVLLRHLTFSEARYVYQIWQSRFIDSKPN